MLLRQPLKTAAKGIKTKIAVKYRMTIPTTTAHSPAIAKSKMFLLAKAPIGSARVAIKQRA